MSKRRKRVVREAPCIDPAFRRRVREAVRRVNQDKANSKAAKVARGKGLTQR